VALARGGRLSDTTTREDLIAPTPYSSQRAYANSKQANLLFSQELHRRAIAAGSPVSSVAVHPGVSSTNLFPRLLGDYGAGVLAPVARVVSKPLLQSAEAGALPTLRGLDHSTPSGAFVGPAHLGQVRGRPELLEVYSTGKDRATAERLWTLTEDILGAPLPV
jgi:NAD(P)-dependent dehydrogenase (short-subunit alcohol dehydrogenase family)